MAEIGRPTEYSSEIANKICEFISTSTLGLSHFCKTEGNPHRSTIYEWLLKHKDFADNYARAKDIQADKLAEEIIEIADDGTNDLMTVVKGDMSYEMENKEVTNRSKLRVDARKWLAGKLAPKKYGDKIDVTTKGNEISSGITFITEVTTDVRGKDKDNASAE